MVTQLELLKHLEYLHQLNDEERFEMSKICKPLFLPKKTKLVESDDMFNYVFVLTTGLLRWYFYSEDGTENNVFFLPKQMKPLSLEFLNIMPIKEKQNIRLKPLQIRKY